MLSQHAPAPSPAHLRRVGQVGEDDLGEGLKCQAALADDVAAGVSILGGQGAGAAVRAVLGAEKVECRKLAQIHGKPVLAAGAYEMRVAANGPAKADEVNTADGRNGRGLDFTAGICILGARAQ